jgi:hypothetical protein
MSNFVDVAVLSWLLPGFVPLAFVREAGRGWLPRKPKRPARRSDVNPAALVALADMELAAGREREATLLLEAAYAAFDFRLKTSMT